ncbi:MAG: hypothetical protein M1831_005060 [Alyxoria varia]|nr:MAG: hypothetical protein M1831_005060 [Alyxoria varia]
MSKSALRKTITQRLGDVSTDSVHRQSQNAVERLLQHPRYKSARRLSVFLSIAGKEIQTRNIVIDALKAGKRVFIPHVHKVATVPTMDMLALNSLEDYEELKTDKWGIPTLSKSGIGDQENVMGGIGLTTPDTQEVAIGEQSRLDLVVMPGLAFDSKLNRLGHGRGYYDRFLQRYSTARARENGSGKDMPSLIALALNEQILPSDEVLPTTENDWQVDELIDGNGEVHGRSI